MNLTGRPPIGLKADRPRNNPAYLARVRSLPCCICEAFGERQESATQAHHPFHDRYSTVKALDEMAIPLCWDHHLGPKGIHTNKTEWRAKYGADHEWIAATKDKLGI